MIVKYEQDMKTTKENI